MHLLNPAIEPDTATARTAWDWQAGTREVARLPSFANGQSILELRPSPDGEQLATIVEQGPDRLRAQLDSEVFEPELEKAWHLRFLSDGRPWLLARVDDEWTVMVGGRLWDERWEFAWNPRVSANGRALAVQIKRDMQYAVAVDGKPWAESFVSIRDYALSDDGTRVAAAAQLEELPEADIFKFLEGTWTMVVDGVPWKQRFLNVYAPTVAPDGSSVVAEVRTGITEYTVARDDTAWRETFGCVWEPRFRGQRVLVPARRGGGWTLVEDGAPLWAGSYVQLWNHAVSPDQSRVAATVATRYGRWTIAVDDAPWPIELTDMVGPPRWSPAGDRVATVTKADNRWGVAVDGRVWPETWDMVWEPAFSPDGAAVVAKVERAGQYTCVVDGRPWSESFSHLWEPVFSPDSKHLLVRGVQDGSYVRHVVPVAATQQRGVS
jgi:hypothetical protein